MPVSQMSAVSSRAHVGSPLAFPWPNTCPEKGAAPEEHLRVGKRPRCLHSAQSRPWGGDTRTEPTQPQPGGEAGARSPGLRSSTGRRHSLGGPQGTVLLGLGPPPPPSEGRAPGRKLCPLPPSQMRPGTGNPEPEADAVRREHRPGVGRPGCRWDPRLPAFDHDAHARGQAPGPQTQASRGSHTRDGGRSPAGRGRWSPGQWPAAGVAPQSGSAGRPRRWRRRSR